MRRIEKRGEVNVLCDDYGCSPATKAEAEFFDEITRLRAEVASLTAQLQSGESFHAVAVRQRDAAWREVEALKATMTQQCKGFRADVEKLEAEVEALRADAQAVAALLPGPYYMDPPDGGSVTVIEQLRRMAADAARYRWLRAQHWHDGPMCVVVAPKQSVKLGADCPSEERLDALIYAARAAQGELG